MEREKNLVRTSHRFVRRQNAWTDFADGFDELFAGISTPDEVIEHIDESLESAKN